jgi:tetratricopeptide (TPR) repeat protein
LRKVALVAIALIVCSLLTWNQTQYWQSDKTVHQQALKGSPDSAFLHNELGKIYKKDGKIGRALEYYRLAAQLDPRNAAVQYNLGKILEQAGMINQALQHYASFLAQDPPAYRAAAETLRRRLKAQYGLTLAENPQ